MRIAGIDIPDNKRGEIALTYIYGLGRSASQKVLSEAGIDFNKKVSEWTEEESNKIRNIISTNFKIEGDLKSEQRLNIKRLLDNLPKKLYYSTSRPMSYEWASRAINKL